MIIFKPNLPEGNRQFLRTEKTKAVKEDTNKLDFYKAKAYDHQRHWKKKKRKRQASDWEKITKHISDKGVVSRYTKNYHNSVSQTTQLNWAKKLNRHYNSHTLLVKM